MRCILLEYAFALCVGLATIQATEAQHGHPLVGSWTGYLVSELDVSRRILVVMDYNGSRISGRIHAGSERASIIEAVLDPNTWRISIVAVWEDPNSDGRRIQLVGTLDNVSAVASRTYSGIWHESGTTGQFQLTLN